LEDQGDHIRIRQLKHHGCLAYSHLREELAFHDKKINGDKNSSPETFHNAVEYDKSRKEK